MATTIINSIKVKPFCTCAFILILSSLLLGLVRNLKLFVVLDASINAEGVPVAIYTQNRLFVG
jgi:hypothetical protein